MNRRLFLTNLGAAALLGSPTTRLLAANPWQPLTEVPHTGYYTDVNGMVFQLLAQGPVAQHLISSARPLCRQYFSTWQEGVARFKYAVVVRDEREDIDHPGPDDLSYRIVARNAHGVTRSWPVTWASLGFPIKTVLAYSSPDVTIGLAVHTFAHLVLVNHLLSTMEFMSHFVEPEKGSGHLIWDDIFNVFLSGTRCTLISLKHHEDDTAGGLLAAWKSFCGEHEPLLRSARYVWIKTHATASVSHDHFMALATADPWFTSTIGNDSWFGVSGINLYDDRPALDMLVLS